MLKKKIEATKILINEISTLENNVGVIISQQKSAQDLNKYFPFLNDILWCQQFYKLD
jgi:hypothetical protein